MEIARPAPPPSSGTTSVSLYQETMSLIEKLYSLSGFDFYLFPEGVDSFVDNATLLDPVAVIWACFRLGSPFCHLYNQLRPRKRLPVPELPSVAPPYTNSCKKAVYDFVVACKAELQMSDKDLFSISGLYKDDTNEFVKLMKTISIVVQKIQDLGLFPPPRPLPFSVPTSTDADAPSGNRAKLLAEMLNTERVYTADLEKLQRYQRELQNQNAVPRDTLLQLFANLDELLDFQRRFLLQMEATLSLPPVEQRIGQLFMQNEDAFGVYVPFCGNYQFATQLAMEEAVQLRKVPDMDPMRELPSYLIKPVQRVCKYPLLLNELIKYSDAGSYPYMDELKDGLEAIKRVTDRVNEEKRREENRRVKKDVIERVEDWKGLNVADFGELLLSDKFPMSTGESERDYDLFLFEHILLCCKDTTKKRKSKKNAKEDTTTYSLKGNIYIERIDSITNESNAAQQRFQIKVFWRDGMDMESFVLRCRNIEQVKLWKDRLDGLLQVQRMRKLSIRENNPYTKSTQLHPDIVRGLGGGLFPAYDDYEEDSGNQRYSPIEQRYEEMPLPIQRSKSIPYNYYPNETSGSSSAQSRKSAPAKARAKDAPPSNDYYKSSEQYYRARSSSPPRNGRIMRDTSPPPPMPDLPSSPAPGGMPRAVYNAGYDPRTKRERSRSRPREEPPRGPLPPPPQLPLPEAPGSLLSGIPTSRMDRRPPPPAAPLPGLPDSRRINKSERGYFDGYDDIYDSGYASRRGDYSSASEFPPSPPASRPVSPMERRKPNAPPPPISTARSMTSPYPSSQSTANELFHKSRNQEGGRKGSLGYGYEAPLRGDSNGVLRVTVGEGYYRSNSSPDITKPYLDSQRARQQPGSYGPPNMPLPPPPINVTMPQRNGNYPPPSSAVLPSTLATPTTATPTSASQPMTLSIKIKMHYGSGVFVVAVPAGCSFTELQSRMERKVRLCGEAVPEGKRLRMRYKDEDGDFITINNSEDVSMAFETGRGVNGEKEKGFVNLWIA